MSNPAGSRANLKTALDRLQKTVTEQRQTIDKLRNENKQLKSDLEKTKKNNNSNNNKNKKKNGGVEVGPSQGDAKNALAGLLGGKVKLKKNKGGVSTGPSKSAAKNALAGALMKKKTPTTNNSNNSTKKNNGGGGGTDKYAQIFKKYEFMIKLGTSVQSAINRMVQDGIDKKIIEAFTKKHQKDDETKEVSWEDIGLQPKKDVKVTNGIKMKRLHWEPIGPKYVLNSIWEKLNTSEIDYEPKKFELKFQVKQRKPDNEKKNKNTNSFNKNKNQNGGEIKLFVSKKRSQQVQIGLKGLSLSNNKIRGALLSMNDKVMNPDTLAKLMDIAPTSDEQTETEKQIMTNGTGNPKNYGLVEQFFYCLYDFYNLNQRLKLWMFKQTFAEIQDSLLSQYKSVEIACTKVRTNKDLKKLFTIILAFGNHMNSETRKGKAYGFNLKILGQLSQVKSMDGSLSFLMYLYQFCDSKYPKIIDSMTDLTKTLKGAASMEMEVLKTAYSRIKDNMTQIKNLVTSDEIENYDIDDRFIAVMTKFNKKAQPKMKQFNSTVKNVIISTKRLLKKFAFGTDEDPQSIEALFKLLYNFCIDFEKARDKLIKLEKERQKRLAKRQKELAKKKNISSNKSIPTNKNKIKGAWSKKVLPTKPPPSRNINKNNKINNYNDDSKDDDLETPILRGKTLTKKLKQKMDFDKKVSKHKRKLTLHIKDRSRFVSTGGKDEASQKNDTMRRISSMYQNDMNQISAIEEARKKAAMLRFNKFKLPGLPGNRNGTGKNSALMRPMRNGILSDKEAGLVNNPNEKYDPRKKKGTGAFIPDDKPIMAPPSKKRQTRNTKSKPLPTNKNYNNNNFPPPSNKIGSSQRQLPKLTMNNSNSNSNKNKYKKRKSKSKKNVPPPPSLPPNKYNKKLPNKPPPSINDPHKAFVQQNQMGLNISNHNLAMANQINNNNNNLNYVGGNNPHYNNWLQQQNRYWQQQQQYWQQQQNLALNQFNRPSPGSKWAK